MPPTIRSPKLDSRNARTKLPPRSAPYFVKLHQGLQLGYAKGSKGGSWIGRRYVRNKQYEKQKLGLADDLTQSDGLKILDFWQAQEAVKAWAEHRRFADKGMAQHGPYSVADAISDYLAHLASTKGPKAEADGRSNATAHILEPLGAILINDLTADRITKWHRALANSPKLVRTKTNARTRATRPTPENADAHRKRRARANRILTVLKAALNYAFHIGKVGSDQAWRRVKPFARVDVAVIRHLSSNEISRLVAACAPAFKALVHGALLTGCRYGELTRLRVANVNLETGIATVCESKEGKPRHVVLTMEAMELFRQLGHGKQSEEPLFLRADGNPWRASHQRRPLIEASKQAGIEPAVSFHILRHTYASILAMRGVPMGVIAAQLGHADTRMTEKHYAHLAPSYVAETIRANFPELLPSAA